MRNRSLGFRPWLSGVTVGGSAGQPVSLVVLTVIVLAMAIVTVIDGAVRRPPGFDPDRKVPFKCVGCGNVQSIRIGDLQKMQPVGQEAVMSGPMILPCEKCSKKTLTQAVECPKCSQIFVMKIDPVNGIFDDKCSKCGESYAKAWQERYRKDKGQ